MDRAGIVACVRAPGDDQWRQQLRPERLVATVSGDPVRGRLEVHERQPAVGLRDAVLKTGGDPKVLGFDGERERRELVGRQ